MNNKIRLLLIVIVIFSSYSYRSLAQIDPHQPEDENIESVDIQKTRKSYLEAIRENDTQSIFDNAWMLTVHYNKMGNTDSIYHYNNAIISTGLEVGEYRKYLDAQQTNYFIDSKINIDQTSAQNRIDIIKSIQKNKNFGPEEQYIIQSMVATQYYHRGILDSTFYYHQRALEHSAEIGLQHENYVTSRMQMAVYMRNAGRSAEALRYLTEIENQFKSYPPTPIVEITYYGYLCNNMINLDEVEITKNYLAKMEQLIAENEYTSFASTVNYIKAKIANKKGNIPNAIQYFKEALKGIKSKGFNSQRPNLWSNLGNAYYNLDELDNMKIYMDSLLSNYDILPDRNKAHYHQLNIKYQLEQKKYDAAKRSLDYINAYNQKPTEARLSIAKLNHLYYQRIGDIQQELTTYKRYTSLKDSLSNISNKALAKRIESEFNREKQDIKIDALTETTAAQDKAISIRNNALLMGSIMLFILGLLLYSLYRLYKENQKQTIKITKALEDNQMLIKEIHHRVKNNLQVVSSLLSMQARKIEDGDMKQALNSSMTRVQSMSILHQNLYSATNPKDVDVDEYFNKLVENILSTYSIEKDVKFDVDIDKMAFDIDVMVPLGLIANELITNALKYAFAGRPSGNLSVSLKEKGNKIILRVADNGIGFEGNELPIREGSIGTRLIKSFTKKLKGDLKITHEKGTEITILFDKTVLDGNSES